jgi:hypothetical protein
MVIVDEKEEEVKKNPPCKDLRFDRMRKITNYEYGGKGVKQV